MCMKLCYRPQRHGEVRVSRVQAEDKQTNYSLWHKGKLRSYFYCLLKNFNWFSRFLRKIAILGTLNILAFLTLGSPFLSSWSPATTKTETRHTCTTFCTFSSASLSSWRGLYQDLAIRLPDLLYKFHFRLDLEEICFSETNGGERNNFSRWFLFHTSSKPLLFYLIFDWFVFLSRMLCPSQTTWTHTLTDLTQIGFTSTERPPITLSTT